MHPYLLNKIKSGWLADFTTYQWHQKHVGLTVLTLLRLNLEKKFDDNQIALLSKALHIAVQFDVLNRDEIDHHSYAVACFMSRVLMYAAIKQTQSPTLTFSTLRTDAIQYHYECMMNLRTSLEEQVSDKTSLTPDPLLQVLGPLNMPQRLSILKTEQKHAAFEKNARATAIESMIADYDALINMPSTTLTDSQVQELMTILKRTNTFNVIIREGETALGLALKNRQRNFVLALMQHDPNLICANQAGYSPCNAYISNTEIIYDILTDHPELYERLTADDLCRPISSGYFAEASTLFLFSLPGGFSRDDGLLRELLERNPNLYGQISLEALCRVVPGWRNTCALYWILFHSFGADIVLEILKQNQFIQISGGLLTESMSEQSSILSHLLFMHLDNDDKIAKKGARILNILARRNPDLGRQMSYLALFSTDALNIHESHVHTVAYYLHRFPQFKNNVAEFFFNNLNLLKLNLQATDYPLTFSDCIGLVNLFRTYIKRNFTQELARKITRFVWLNFQDLIIADMQIHPQIDEKLINHFLKMFPQFSILLANNTRQQMLAAYQEKGYICDTVMVLNQAARQQGNIWARLPRLAINHIAMFTSTNPELKPETALQIAEQAVVRKIEDVPAKKAKVARK